MTILNKLTIKNLKLNKKRTIVTIVGIILSVALIAAVATMYASGLKSLIVYEKTVNGNFHVAFKNVPRDNIKDIENNFGVDKVFLTNEVGYATLKESKNNYKPYAYILGMEKDGLTNLSINLIEGRLPEKEGEILIPTHLETNGRIKLNVGDVITLDVGDRLSDGYKLNQENGFFSDNSEKIENTQSITYKVVGKIKRPATNVEPYSAPGYTFITYLDKNKMSDNLNVYALYNKEGAKKYQKVTANILGINEDAYHKYVDGIYESEEDWAKVCDEVAKAKYKGELNQYLLLLEVNPIKNSGMNGLDKVVAIVCIIICITSVFCIKNSFDISITEKTKQYGMLRSVGATKKQIRKNVFYEATILGIIGIPLGLISGFVASFILIKVCNYLMEGMLSNGLKLVLSYSLISYIIAALLGAITIYISAIKSAYNAGKITPLELIRNSGKVKIKDKKLRVPKFIKKIFGIGGELSYKNIKRNKKKYCVTVLSITLSVAVFTSLTYFMSTFMEIIQNTITYSEYNISYRMKVQEDNQRVISKIVETTKLDNIDDLTVLRTATFKLDNPKVNEDYISEVKEDIDLNYISLISVGNQEYQKYLKSLNLSYEEYKNKGILIDNINYSFTTSDGKNLKREKRVYSYKNGNIINGSYDINEKVNLSIQIGAVSDTRPFGLKNETNTKYLLVSDEYYDQNINGNFYYELFFNSTNPNKLQDDIDNVLKDENYSLDNKEENALLMKRYVVLIGIFLYGFITIITLIGITNIFNTITTNMQLRKPEFAMLKSIGMTKKEFNKMIRLESIFICVKSLLYGLTIGISLSYIIYYYLAYPEGLKFKLPFICIIISGIFVYLLIFMLMKYSLNKINKINMIETIRNQNI